MCFLHQQQCVAHRFVASEDVDTTRWHLLLHQAAIAAPVEIRRRSRHPWIGAADALTEYDVSSPRYQDLEELLDEFGRFLEIGCHDREVLAGGNEQTLTYGAERAEVPRQLDEDGAERCVLQLTLEQRVRVIGAAVDDEHRLELARHARGDAGDRVE